MDFIDTDCSTIKPIRHMVMTITNKCNLACPYCFANHDTNKMTYQTAKDIVDFCISNCEDNQSPHITFFGGEPLLEWDTIIVPITNYIRNDYGKPFSLSITSNCTLMSEDKIKFLKDNNISLMFSIDGGKNTQDKNRPLISGGSSFSLLEDKIPMILAYLPECKFRITLQQETCNNLFDDLSFITQSGCVNYEVIPNYFETWTDKNKEIVDEQLSLYTNDLLDRFRLGLSPIIYESFRSCWHKIILINHFYKEKKYRTRFQCQGCGHCGLGNLAHASCDCFGNVYGCHHPDMIANEINPFYLGSVYDGINYKRVEELNTLYDSKSLTGTNCNTCKLNNICDGGCVPNNYCINGDISVVPDSYCWWNQLILDKAIKIAEILGEEENTTFRDYFENVVTTTGKRR